MAALVQVTTDQVAQAAATLTAQGRRVTGNSLRGVIGQGRPERLAAVWAEQQGLAVQESPPEPDAPALPPAVADHLAEAEARVLADLRGLVVQGWRQASDLAARRVAQEVADARARVAELEDDAVQGIKNLEAADDRAAALADELAQSRVDVEVARVQAAIDADRLAEAERQAKVIRGTIEQMEADLREAETSAALIAEDAAADRARANAADAAVIESRSERDLARTEGKAETRAAAASVKEVRDELSKAQAAAAAAAERTKASDERALVAEARAREATEAAAKATRDALDGLAAALAVSKVEKGGLRRARPPGRGAEPADSDEVSAVS